MEKKKTGRPKKTLPNGEEKYHIPTMCKKIDEYLAKEHEVIPILKECCLLNDWNYDYIMELQREHSILSQSIKKLLNKKEIMLERGLLSGDYNSAGAIFILKQPAHNFKDKWEDNESAKEVLEKLDKVLDKFDGDL